MASLQEFLEVLADAYPDEQVRGKEFELFLRDALVASPSHQFADVWLWDDWPGRDGPDRGIDLVAEDVGRLADPVEQSFAHVRAFGSRLHLFAAER